MINYKTDLAGVDWGMLKKSLSLDNFDSGRTADELRLSFENSFAYCFAESKGEIIGKVRVLSDGVCNAYLVDLWTHSNYRKRGIGAKLVRSVLDKLSGQHVYLFTGDSVDFYKKQGFKENPTGLEIVVGTWLNR